jgi:hypothetical protein
LSRPFRLNYVISFIFYLYLMLHACVQRFDVTGNLKILVKFLASKRCLRIGMALRNALGWSEGDVMRPESKPFSRLMSQTAGIFSGALAFWVLCRLHYDQDSDPSNHLLLSIFVLPFRLFLVPPQKFTPYPIQCLDICMEY